MRFLFRVPSVFFLIVFSINIFWIMTVKDIDKSAIIHILAQLIVIIICFLNCKKNIRNAFVFAECLMFIHFLGIGIYSYNGIDASMYFNPDNMSIVRQKQEDSLLNPFNSFGALINDSDSFLLILLIPLFYLARIVYSIKRKEYTWI